LQIHKYQRLRRGEGHQLGSCRPPQLPESQRRRNARPRTPGLGSAAVSGGQRTALILRPDACAPNAPERDRQKGTENTTDHDPGHPMPEIAHWVVHANRGAPRAQGTSHRINLRPRIPEIRHNQVGSRRQENWIDHEVNPARETMSHVTSLWRPTDRSPRSATRSSANAVPQRLQLLVAQPAARTTPAAIGSDKNERAFYRRGARRRPAFLGLSRRAQVLVGRAWALEEESPSPTFSHRSLSTARR
jgi:hypothetical protein